MLHKEIWGLAFLAFLIWVVLAGQPSGRIERSCRPIGWIGNVTTSLAALAVPTSQTGVQRWFDKVEYGCNYSIWRLFYQKEFLEWQAAQEAAAAHARPADTSERAVEEEPSEAEQAASAASEADSAQ